MGHTIERVEEMSGLAAQLERRQADRTAASGPVVLRVAGVPEPIRGTLVNTSSGGMRVAVDRAAAALMVVGDVVDTSLGLAADAVEVHARIANAHGDEIGLQLFITDDEQGARIDRYFSSVSS
jgi:hypothetical protein